MRAVFKSIGDVERTVNRIIQGIATPRDLVRLRESLRAMPELLQLLAHEGIGHRKISCVTHEEESSKASALPFAEAIL